MSKKEFIDRLSMALNGKLSPGLVADNINYYEDYINMEVRKGRSEEEVLKMLGDPRLIAKTIVETSGRGNNSGYQNADTGGSAYRETDYNGTGRNHGKVFRMPGWLMTVIIILIMILIVSTIFSVLSFLAPIIVPIIVVMLLIKLFDWLN